MLSLESHFNRAKYLSCDRIEHEEDQRVFNVGSCIKARGENVARSCAE
jgi:hypothetical protein